MITYATPANYWPALIVGDRLQKALNYLHNANTPFGSRVRKIDDLVAARAEAVTLWMLLWTDFKGIEQPEADRLRDEIASAYENAVIRHRAKRGRTTTAA